MNAQGLLNLYERVADAPAAVPMLRSFLLDLAVRGKLVEQDATDEPASKLLKRIAAAKMRLVRDGKFKVFEGDIDRDKDNFPFKIPSNWCWCYLDDIAAVARGGSPRPIKSFITDDPKGIPWIKIGDAARGSIYIDKTQERIKREGLAKSRLVIQGDLLLSNSMSFGHPYITNIEGCIHDGWLVIRTPDGLICKLFLHVMFRSGHAKVAFSEAASGAVVQNLNADKARRLAIPLPPFAEQQRIVARVHELMAFCDRLAKVRTAREDTRDRLTEASYARLSAFDSDDVTFRYHARFAVNVLPALTARAEQVKRLRQAVLDLAVRGKLVTQDPADEPASKLLKRIEAEKSRLLKADEISGQKAIPALKQTPFAVPKQWCWVPIRGITSHRGQKVPDVTFTYIDVTAIDKENGSIVRPKILDPHEAPSRARKIAHAGDVIYSCVRPYLLNVAIIEEDLDPAPIVSTAFAIMNGHGLVLPRYLWIVLRSPFMVACVEKGQRGQAYPAINDAAFAALPFPLPPLAEQHRIVVTVNELLALCDRLEGGLGATATGRCRLLESLLHLSLELR